MEKLVFSKPSIDDVVLYKYIIANAANVLEAARATREIEDIERQIAEVGNSPKTISEAVETLEKTAAGFVERIDSWLMTCIHATARGVPIPTNRLDRNVGDILLALMVDRLKTLSENIVEAEDSLGKDEREAKLDSLGKKLTSLQNKVKRLIPDEIREQNFLRSRLWEMVTKWHEKQRLTVSSVDPFGTSLSDENPFAESYSQLGIAKSIPSEGRFEANRWSGVEYFYTVFK